MIRVEGLTKRYEGPGAEMAEPAVAELSFENDTGHFLTLLGPSGCGKSTTLRCIAGLETPDAGVIEIGGKVVYSAVKRLNLSPARRRIGMVFQSYAIWPHMSVLENVAYPLRFTKTSSRQRDERAGQVLEIVGLGGLAERAATRLSGGQQQRVALARALVAEPEVLLLDEPLSNLDAALRRDLGGYVRNLQQKLGLTVIYVTHDQGEALSMSDTVALMNRGRIVERGAPEQLYSQPRTEFSAAFLGDANFLAVTAVGSDGTVETPEGTLNVTHLDAGETADGECSVMIRPEAVRLGGHEGGDDIAANSFKCEVVAERFFGGYREYRLRTENGWEFTAETQGGRRAAQHTWAVASVAVGDCVIVANTEAPPNREGSDHPEREELAATPSAEEHTESKEHHAGSEQTKEKDRPEGRTSEEVNGE